MDKSTWAYRITPTVFITFFFNFAYSINALALLYDCTRDYQNLKKEKKSLKNLIIKMLISS